MHISYYSDRCCQLLHVLLLEEYLLELEAEYGDGLLLDDFALEHPGQQPVDVEVGHSNSNKLRVINDLSIEYIDIE